ncbi:MAG: hypothetical protein A2663_00520 [Candidatus Buchananbacteria bacterium RIFCSPHIGHO2_01_FULL_46_12]|uniref:Uncharacterized protein n=1 Tax=Candidatus Buchananbacteria bacterium RIFCSPHIGHO2_01_FULL_46_12 TaxID=1797536 RepID=A0A1G1Y5B9_9BACT|nr:MAG: hypothetical protein A2663_00520 [Candidatus Buchananbacteria bacterium RIFCSPHIGHO2_01_FULL_46_12]
MKKTLFFGWLVSLIVLAFPALSSAQFQSALTVSGEENTVEMIVVCPDGSVLTADGQDCVSTEPAPAPEPAPAEEPANAATPTVLGTETAVTAEPAINTAVKTNTQPADTAVIAPLEDTKEITGVSFLLEPVNGACPENQLLSDDGKICVKLAPKVITAPQESAEERVDFSAFAPKPENGQCPGEYVLSQDGQACEKNIPQIIIESEESFKEVAMETSGKVMIKDKRAKKEAALTAKKGLQVVASIQSPAEKPDKKIIIESNAASGEIAISAGPASAKTKEAVSVNGNKLFLNKKEVKIMPDAASQTALEKLGAIGFKIELKDTGKPQTAPVYEASLKKDVKILGLFKAQMTIKTKIDSQTGEAGKVIKPWWSFLAV